jgi:hypothetical protein
MYKTTIVTMFYNLKKLKDATHSTRPLDFYVKNGSHTLLLEYPMVIFCDEETLDVIRSVRDKLNDKVPTVYIVKPLMEYDFYQLNFDIIEESRRKRQYLYGEPDQRNTTSYFLITMFKSVCLRIAKMRDDFETQYYAWVDLGCNHVLKNVTEMAPSMLDNPKPKISACYIQYHSPEVLSDTCKWLEEGGPCGIAATVFTAEASYIDRFFNGMMEQFHKQLCLGTGHSDEQTMTLCYHEHPDLFTIFNGDYYSILTNYHVPKQDLQSIKFCYIYETINAGKYDLAKEAIMRILTYLSSRKQDTLSEEELDIKTELMHLYNRPEYN